MGQVAAGGRRCTSGPQVVFQLTLSSACPVDILALIGGRVPSDFANSCKTNTAGDALPMLREQDTAVDIVLYNVVYFSLCVHVCPQSRVEPLGLVRQKQL